MHMATRCGGNFVNNKTGLSQKKPFWTSGMLIPVVFQLFWWKQPAKTLLPLLLDKIG